jgi:hypothetical protein
MVGLAESAVWVDANGRTWQTIIQSLIGAVFVVNVVGPCQHSATCVEKATRVV